jgi:hypothetical protein
VIGILVLLAVNSPATTQPDVSGTVVAIERFAAAQREVDRAWIAWRRAVDRDPELLAKKEAFAKAKQDVLKLRFRGTTEQLQAASNRYLAAKKAIAAAEPLAAAAERANLAVEEARLDALRHNRQSIDKNSPK